MEKLLFPILARRSFISFGLVALLVGALLAAIHLTSRYALKRYVEYQLARIPWDVALYQKGPSGGDEKLRDFVGSTAGVREVASLAFMRARFPEGGEVQARVDGTPLTTPWLSVLAASDISLLPPQLGFALSRTEGDARGAVLALVGPEIAVGKPFLSLQGARRFVMQVTTLGTTDIVFETPIRQVVRLDRDELNRWLMDQTGSVSYVPAIGAILLMPYDWSVITRFDFVANGIVPGDLAGTLGSEQIHVQQAEYAPEIVYLARIDRERLISGWDLPGSLANVTALTRRLHADAAEQGPQPKDSGQNEAHHGAEEEAAEGPHPDKFGGISYVIDSTTEVLLARMQATARSIGVLSVLIALPLLWMAWVLGANLTGLLMLNERRTLGLLRLRGVPAAAIGRVLVASVGVAGAIGGALGLTAGSILTLVLYERGALSFSVLADRAQVWTFVAFLAVTVVMALLVSRRFVRYATTISPLEATRRVSATEASHTAPRLQVSHIIAFVAGTFVLASWIFGVSLAEGTGQPWLRTIEQLLYFLGLPLFVFGVGSILTTSRGGLHQLMKPVLRVLGGRLGNFTLRHLSAKPHRTSAFLLIVALMSSVSLYPVITSSSFQEKADRGARVQIGADWQLLYNTPDLVDSAQLSGSAGEQLPAIAGAVEPLLASLRAVEGVTAATYMVEALLPNFYLPGYGLRGVPLYLLGDVAAYQRHVYSEPRVGLTAAFDAMLQRMRVGDVATSASVADFWQLAPGTRTVVGLTRTRQPVDAPSAGTLAFLPGLPPKTVSDRQGYVQARIDYLNYLLGTNAYLAAAADAKGLGELQLLAPRVVVMLRTRDDIDADRLRAALSTATSVAPLEIHSLEEEVQKVGNDMYIALALANMRIYLIGGLLLAIVAMVAIAAANYAEDRRTLALLRIRGASPASLWRFLLAALLAPALVGLAVGAVAAAIAGFGLANYVWQLRAVRTVVQLLPTHLVVEPITGGLALMFLLFLVAVAAVFAWWAFRDTAHKTIRSA